MSSQRHVIQKQVLEIHLPSKQASFELQTKFSRTFQQKIIPAIDVCLSEISDPGAILRIDVLEIDLGSVDLDESETVLTTKIIRCLRRQLARYQEAPAGFSSQTCHATDGDHSKAEMITYFIKTGSVPWWAGKLSAKDLADALEGFLGRFPDAAAAFLAEVASDSRIIKRLIYQFPGNVLMRWAGLFFTSNSTFLTDLDDDLREIFKHADAPFERSHVSPAALVHQILFTAVISMMGHVMGTRLLLTSVLEGITEALNLPRDHAMDRLESSIRACRAEGVKFKTQISEIVAALTHRRPIFDSQDEIENNLLHRPPNSTRRFSQQSKDDIRAEAEFAMADPASPTQTSSLPALRGITMPRPEARRTSISPPGVGTTVHRGGPLHGATETVGNDTWVDSEKHYLHNAGMVIVWPYLVRFFSQVGLVHELGFMDESAQQRAVLLLQYLVDGSEASSENLLPLNKILCGFDLWKPLNNKLNIRKVEAAESAELLKSVIANWKLLKNTTPSGLQEAFLQREGILRRRYGIWLLQVESKSYDVVLTKLPWSLQIIKLPWMTTVLQVEWPCFEGEGARNIQDRLG